MKSPDRKAKILPHALKTFTSLGVFEEIKIEAEIRDI